ncbi:hypothetical protein L2712_03975 [Shewanella marisflavi]|nr:hypothetical protein [Shewanella marisflavi]MCL1040811.1 hypothetical protein [Shewanella marisflavi]
MKHQQPLLLAIFLAFLASAAQAADKQALLADALSAAPPTLRDKVTVMDWDKNVLQQGSSNYTCFPTPPSLKGTAPMCMDGP